MIKNSRLHIRSKQSGLYFVGMDFNGFRNFERVPFGHHSLCYTRFGKGHAFKDHEEAQVFLRHLFGLPSPPYNFGRSRGIYSYHMKTFRRQHHACFPDTTSDIRINTIPDDWEFVAALGRETKAMKIDLKSLESLYIRLSKVHDQFGLSSQALIEQIYENDLLEKYPYVLKMVISDNGKNYEYSGLRSLGQSMGGTLVEEDSDFISLVRPFYSYDAEISMAIESIEDAMYIKLLHSLDMTIIDANTLEAA